MTETRHPLDGAHGAQGHRPAWAFDATHAGDGLLVGVTALVVFYNRTLYVPPDAPRPDIILRGGLLFDGTGAAARPNPGIVLSEGVITCIGGDCATPADAVEIACRRRAWACRVQGLGG